MALGTIRPIALSHFVQECLSLMISHRCHSALYGCLVHDFLPEVSHGSLARVQVPARHSRCGASKALRARGSPPSHSILLDLNSSQMVQGVPSRKACHACCFPKASKRVFSRLRHTPNFPSRLGSTRINRWASCPCSKTTSASSAYRISAQ